MKKNKLIAMIGPTAVGKTNLSIALAKRLETEIISGDSMLIYQGMDIGTAKPTLEERAGIVHHLVDILTPKREFSVTDFKAAAEILIEEMNAKNKIPLLVGGTGLYVKSLVEDYQFNQTSGDEAYRLSLETLAEKEGKAYVHAMLAKVDPRAAARLHVNDFRRVIRALEVYHLGGEYISQEKLSEVEPAYDAAVIGLTMERTKLYERIHLRVDMMLESGLVAEVEKLLAEGVSPSAQAMQGIGYKEVVLYLKGQISLAETAEQIKKSTRHFAKRQMTWFRKMPYIQWYETDQYTPEELVENIYTDLAGKFSLGEN